MATQSFTDFVGRGQQNLYQGSAPTATVLPQQEIQRLLAELRRGGARAQNAMRILQSTPEGRQAIQTVSAPAPAPAPAPVAPAPAPARPRPQTAQPTQSVDVQRPDPTSLSGAFFNYNPLGQAIRGIGRAHAPAGEQALDALSGLERFAQAEILDLGYIPPHLRDYVRENVKPLGVDLQEYEAAKEAQREIDRADRSLGRFNPFTSAGTRALSDPKWREEATQLPVHLPFIAEGRSPAFHLSALDVAGAVADPTNIIGVGPGTKIAKELRQFVPYLETLQKPARRTPGQVLQEGGQSLVEEFAPVTRKVEEAARATGREALRQAERMPGGIPGVVQAAPGPIIPGRGEGFKLPSDLARSRVTPKFGRDAPAKNIVFESDFDRALYIATAKNRSARRDTFEALVREELQARGLDPNRMTEIAAPMKRAVQEAAQATDEFDVAFPAFRYADEVTPTAAPRGAGGEYRVTHRPNSEGPRGHDLLEKDLAPSDIYESPSFYVGSPGDAAARESIEAIKKIRGNPDATITVYRASPVDELNSGDWISLSRSYAKTHGFDAVDESLDIPVREYQVRAKDIRWDGNSLEEWGYFPERIADEPTTQARQADAAARGAVDPDTVVTPRVGADTRFLELAAAQRGEAERLGTSAMIDAGGKGIRQFLTESIGDIIQRMSRQMPDDYDATIEKVQRGIRDLRRPEFADDIERQLRSNYNYGVKKGEITESFEAYKARALDIQSQYAVAHSKLPVINQAHRDAQEAAVAFGEQRYGDSLAALRRIESHLGSEEAFDAYRLEGAQPVTRQPTAAARGAVPEGALPTHADVLDSFSGPSEFKQFVIRGETTKPGLYEAGGAVYRLTENGDVTRLQDVVSSYSFKTKKFSFERINQEPVPSEIAPLLEGTKVVDSTGKPLRVFHGTASDFDEFIPFKPKDIGGQTKGIYFEPTKKDAEPWTRQGGVGRSRTGEPRIIEAYVNLKNPVETRSANAPMTSNREELIEQGYDGKISRDADRQITEVVAFDNSQIHQVRPPTTPATQADVAARGAARIDQLPVYEGEAWRTPSGYTHEQGATAGDVIRFEREELGNVDTFSEISDDLLTELDQYQADDVIWVARDEGVASDYNVGNIVGREDDLVSGGRIIHEDSDGVLVLKPKQYRRRPTAAAREVAEEVTPQNLDEIHKLAATNPEAIPPEVAKKAHIEKAAPDPGGSPPRRRQPPTGAIPEEPNELLKRAVDSKMPGERVDEALLREHVGAVRVAEGEARMAVDEGNDMLLALGWGSRKGKVLAPKTPEDIAIADSLHAALHGEGPVPAGYEEIVELARTQTNLEEAMRIDFDPKMATVEDYFFRGWKPPEEIAKATRDSSGNLVMRPGFEFARSGATYSEMRALGFEPLFWNPFEQINQSAKMGLRHRQQSQLIEALKQAGDEIIRPWDKGESGIPAGWRIPKVGPAFEGKPFAAIDPTTGEETVGWTRKWIVQNKVANKLENMYGKTPSMGSIHVGGRDIDLNKVIDTATFIPKQAKLFFSFFQDIDFLSRLGFGSFTGAVDALQRGQPITAVKHLLSLPRGAAELLMARVPYQMVPARTKLGAKIGPARRRALRDSALKDTTPILEGRPGVNRREIMLSALNLRDRTILPPDMDKIVRDIATETGAMKVKSAARAVADFEKMLRDGLFEGTYPAVMWRDIISNIAPSMARMYPELTDAQLVARIASVANTKYSTIPEIMSAIQNRVLRYGLLRLFFSIGESEGLLKQTLGVLKGPNKEFWTKHWLGGYVFLIASANAIHFASTGKGLPSERYSPVSKDSWGPLPFGYNTKFAAPDIPVGGEYGTAVRLDLVGQMDTAFRVLDPQSFVTSRFSVPVRAAMNQATGENFYGAPIDDVGPGGVVSRTAQLGLDMFSPIGVGGVAERVARETVPGAEDLIPKDPSGLSMTGEVIEATGLNLRASLRRNLLERQAMEQFQKPYEQLTQLELFKIKEDPDLKKKLMDMDIEASGRGDVFAEHRIAKNDIRVETRENKISLINTFVKDLFSNDHVLKETRKKLTDLSDSISELSTLEYGRLKQLRIELAKREPKLTGWTGDPPTNDFDKMLNDWYAFYDDPKYKSSGVLDWDKLRPAQDKFTEKLPPVLASQLQEWNDRNDIPGLDDLRGLLGPKKRDGTPWEKATDGKKYYYKDALLYKAINQLLPDLGIQR